MNDLPIEDIPPELAKHLLGPDGLLALMGSDMKATLKEPPKHFDGGESGADGGPVR